MTKDQKRKRDPKVNAGSTDQLRAKKTKALHEVKPTIPFDSEDRILLVGEGDLSFARSLVESHYCVDVTASCYDSELELHEKYRPQAEEHIQIIEDAGCTVLYSVDATTLDSSKNLKKVGLFDRVIFNFPHIGGKTKDVNRQVRFNQELLAKFFASASTLLAPGGTIVVTLFEGEPYTLWNIRDLARHSGLEVRESFKFVPGAYPGYKHSRTLGNIDGGGGWKGEHRDARTYVFQLKGTQQAHSAGGQRKRKRKVEDVSSDEEG